MEAHEGLTGLSRAAFWLLVNHFKSYFFQFCIVLVEKRRSVRAGKEKSLMRTCNAATMYIANPFLLTKDRYSEKKFVTKFDLTDFVPEIDSLVAQKAYGPWKTYIAIHLLPERTSSRISQQVITKIRTGVWLYRWYGDRSCSESIMRR